MEQDLPANEQNWQQSIDPQLVQRLNRPRVQPRVSDNRMADRIIGRVQRMTHQLPVQDAILRKYHPSEASSPRLPVVFAQVGALNSESQQAAADGAPSLAVENRSREAPSQPAKAQTPLVKAGLSVSRTAVNDRSSATPRITADYAHPGNSPIPLVQAHLTRQESTAVIEHTGNLQSARSGNAGELTGRPISLAGAGFPGIQRVTAASPATNSRHEDFQPLKSATASNEIINPTTASTALPATLAGTGTRGMPVVRGSPRINPASQQDLQMQDQAPALPTVKVARSNNPVIQNGLSGNLVMRSTDLPLSGRISSAPAAQGQAQLIYSFRGTDTPTTAVQRSTSLPLQRKEPDAEGTMLNRAIEIPELSETAPVSENTHENENDIDVDDLAEKVMRKLALTMRVERERRGWLK